jgi:hypothetical protein
MAFTLDDYRVLLGQLKSIDYEFVDYHAVDPVKPHVIMRHDVDMSPEFAFRVAQVEADFSIASTYFILITSNLYNPFAGKDRDYIARIAELGHHIGLHFDASIYGNDLDALNDAVRRELLALNVIIPDPHRVISFHRPNPMLLGYEKRVGDCDHTYMPRYFKEVGYCSDSRGQWYYQHPLDHPSIRERTALQLLTHPIWWCGYQGESAISLLDRFTFDRMDFFRTELARNCEIYRKEILQHLARS